MRPADQQRAQQIDAALLTYSKVVRPLAGIKNSKRREVLVAQIVDSMRRVEFARLLSQRAVSAACLDPLSDGFDPLKAAVFEYRLGNVDEAFWLVFLFIHFGRDRSGGWTYIKSVYGQLGSGNHWTFAAVSQNPAAFRIWLAANESNIRNAGGAFGNHRKYLSLSAHAGAGTGAAVETYVNWIVASDGSANLVLNALNAANGDAEIAFDVLYKAMRQVASFGRTARFDYLAMLGKLGFAHIAPGRAYLSGATGPVTGAMLLFGVQAPPKILDDWLVDLNAALGVGMQVLEDALCNWQKSPDKYVAFRG